MDSIDLLVAMRRIMHAVDLHSKKLQKSAGLTIPQLVVLQEIGTAKSVSITQMARNVHLSQATVTSILQRLKAKGLVERHHDEKDRRKVNVTLTSPGQAAIENAPNLLQDTFIEQFESLEPWEQKMLTSAVERIASIMDAETVDASPILQVGEIINPREAGGSSDS